ncbi:cobalt chelatase [Methanoculleus taiwanensis]|uniref:Cobalt chelatase n=1 Tax=Methanoculleus taiwanensis TaxID=1550565 RepID=A0A498H2V7_9EURY|nr:magnesium chelatase subunit H [Methanoculleus taiwanensis]RXE56264.1 cobalt chelatase [Methanoculleus taiwanensis]
MKLACISTVPSPAVVEAIDCLNRDFDLGIVMTMVYPHQIEKEEVDEEALTEALRAAEIVLIDIRGAGRASELAYAALRDGANIVLSMMGPFHRLFEVTRLGSFAGKGREAAEGWPRRADGDAGAPKDRIEVARDAIAASGTDARERLHEDTENYLKTIRYWRYGGRDNYYNLILFLLKRYLGYTALPDAAEPVECPEYGIVHPDLGHFADLDEYFAAAGCRDGRPGIGVMINSGMHLDQNIPQIRAFFEAFPEMNVIPVHSAPEHNLRAIEEFFFRDGAPCVDAVINLKWFRLNGGPLGGDPAQTTRLLRRLNVPVFAPVSLFSQDVEDWERETAGISPVMTIMAVIWPELDGCIEPIPCCGLQTVTVNGVEAKEVLPIPDRLDRICARVGNWIRLKHLANAEKKVAVMIYGYPPGEGNLGRASYLDVFVSVRRMLEAFAGQGYTVELPDRPLHEIFEEKEIVNSGTWFSPEHTLDACSSLDAAEYGAHFRSLDPDVQQDVIECWGPPPGEVMTLGHRFLVPGVNFGNIFVGIQPARPPLDESDVAKAAHDKTKPPHHQYIAYYYWLEHVFGAHVVYHVGTHGLAEFTKGKEIGMSRKCFPDILIGNMPHLYIYSVVNTSESTIAKRRLYGTIISYNSPPFSTSDLYERYVDLETLIDEHEEAVSKAQDLRAERVREKIFGLARELHFSGGSIHEIHEEVYEMKRSIIPMGLHTLGEVYSNEAVKRYVEFILRYDRDGSSSINRILAEAEGLDYDAAIRDKGAYARVLDGIDQKCHAIVGALIDRSDEAALLESGLCGHAADRLRATLAFGLELARDYADNGLELENCLRGMKTEFIEPRLGGDVIRKPEVLPTGLNINQFDPTKIPTQVACERGAEIAENTLAKFREQGEAYPESIGIVLWGFETTNSGGETIGQILRYLGVRVVRRQGSWSPELEVIPLEDLGRPRIDCHLSICGFFRDMFPNITQLLNQAFALVSELPEPPEMNSVRKHSLENLEALRQEIVEGLTDEKHAKKLAYGRIYGPRAGEYGTRTLALLEDAVWKEEKDLAEVYMESMSHLYTDNVHGVKTKGMYQKSIGRVELVSQVRDRHDREIVDLDHYFEYFGGLSKAVETVTGKKPAMMISDTTKEVIKTEDVADVIARGTRTRLLNPKWIDAMLEHDYHGAQQIEERVYNTLGLAATTNAVDNWIWSSIAERFVFDEELLERLKENNKYATAGVMERLFEAESRGYWDATEEEMEKLRCAYLELEGDIEEGL